MPVLIRGDRLNERQRRQVLAAFVHRNTVEKPDPRQGIRQRKEMDAEWLAAHSFWFINDGSRLAANVKHCEPAFLTEPVIQEAGP